MIPKFCTSIVCARKHNTMGFLTSKKFTKWVSCIYFGWKKLPFDFLNDDPLQRKERSSNPWIIVQQKTQKTLLQNVGVVH